MLQYRQHRYGTEFNELRRYADWLGAEAAHLEAEHSPTQTVDFALHYQRVLLNYVVTVENLVSVAGHEPDTSTQHQHQHQHGCEPREGAGAGTRASD